MANNSNPHKQPQGMSEHNATYEGFIKGSVVLSLICGFACISLVAFRFIDSFNVLIGFAGIIAGSVATLIDLRIGKSWYLSGGLLVLYGLFVAANV
jgi:hypothetical protein